MTDKKKLLVILGTLAIAAIKIIIEEFDEK